jgi:hypothetical protein
LIQNEFNVFSAGISTKQDGRTRQPGFRPDISELINAHAIWLGGTTLRRSSFSVSASAELEHENRDRALSTTKLLIQT